MSILQQEPSSFASQAEHDAYENALRLAAVKRFKNSAVRDVPYEERSVSYLRYDCLARGIYYDCSRDVMISRLRAHDRGEPTLPLRDEPPTLPIMVAPQPTPVYTRGTLGLLGLPHEVIREFILFHLIDHADVFTMLRVCKYVYLDARAVLCQRAAAVFQCQQPPKALYLHCALHEMDGFRYPSKCDTVLKSIAYPSFLWSSAELAACITKHGSIEALQTKYIRGCIEANCHTSDILALEYGRDRRTYKCYTILVKCGFPTYFQFRNIGFLPNEYISHFSSLEPRFLQRVEHILKEFIMQEKNIDVEAQIRRLLKTLNFPLLLQCVETMVSIYKDAGFPSLWRSVSLCKDLYFYNLSLCGIPFAQIDVKKLYLQLGPSWPSANIFLFWQSKDTFLQRDAEVRVVHTFSENDIRICQFAQYTSFVCVKPSGKKNQYFMEQLEAILRRKYRKHNHRIFYFYLIK